MLSKDVVVLYLPRSINRYIRSKYPRLVFIEYETHTYTQEHTGITYYFSSLVRLWANTVPDRATEHRIGARVR